MPSKICLIYKITILLCSGKTYFAISPYWCYSKHWHCNNDFEIFEQPGRSQINSLSTQNTKSRQKEKIRAKLLTCETSSLDLGDGKVNHTGTKECKYKSNLTSYWYFDIMIHQKNPQKLHLSGNSKSFENYTCGGSKRCHELLNDFQTFSRVLCLKREKKRKKDMIEIKVFSTNCMYGL